MLRTRRNSKPESNSTALLLSYYNQYYQSFTGHFKESPRRFNKKIIHDLRLEIKSLRSVFHFLDHLESGKIGEIESYSIMTDLFQISGMVREEQVNLSLLRKFESLQHIDKVREYFIKRKKSAYRKFHQLINKLDFNMIDLINRSITGRIERIKQDEILKHSQLYIQRGFRKIKRLSKDLTDSNLHDIRKELKAVKNILDIRQLIDPNQNPERLLSQIMATEVKIGAWHNRLIFRTALKEFMKNELSVPIKKETKKLVKKTEKQNQRGKSKIKKGLKSLSQLIE